MDDFLEECKGVEVVDVCGPFVGMEPDLVLVDTPGAGSLHVHHDALLHAVIPHSDAVIFLVTRRMPIDQDEIALLEKVKSSNIQRVFFAINKKDEITNPQDLHDALMHNRECLERVGIHVETIYEISAQAPFGASKPRRNRTPAMKPKTPNPQVSFESWRGKRGFALGFLRHDLKGNDC